LGSWPLPAPAAPRRRYILAASRCLYSRHAFSASVFLGLLG